MKSSGDPDKKKLKVSLNGKEKVPGLKQRYEMHFDHGGTALMDLSCRYKNISVYILS